MTKEKSLYLVPWIEVEFGWGSRPEGFRVFSDIEKCKKETTDKAKDGNYEGGYIGPEKPLRYFEVPFDESIAKETFIDQLPKFRSRPEFI